MTRPSPTETPIAPEDNAARSVPALWWLVPLLSISAFLLIWAVIAWILQNPRVLPGPVSVARVMIEETAAGRMGHHVLATLIRVGISFALAMVIGTVLGYLVGRSPRVDRWTEAWVTIFLNTPALVVIVLCYLWIGLNEVAAIAAVTINKTAMVIVTLREGTRALDPRLAEMARVYRVPTQRFLRHWVLPQLAPFLASAARNGLSVIWKVVLVVEFLGRSDGVGFQIHLKFQLFDIAGVMAYAAAFVAVMLAIDYALIQPLERRANRWRKV